MFYYRNMDRELALANTCVHLETGRSRGERRARISGLARGTRASTGVRNAEIDPERKPVALVVLIAPALGVCFWAGLAYLAATLL